MSSTLFISVALIAGLILGIFFFWGLWYSVRRAVASRRPALWLIGSFLVRTCVTLIGFYYCARGSWQGMLACLVGFIAARYLVMHIVNTTDEKQILLKKEASHETES
jgi:F1F0 ATPase subunit 2